MTTQETFLERMQPVLDGMPKGPDKDKLLALIEAQDAVERVNVHPRDRTRAMRRLLQIDTVRASGNGPPTKGRGKTP